MRLINASSSYLQSQVRNGWVHATLSPPPGGSSSSNTVTGDWVVNFDPFGGDAYTSATSISLLEGKIKTAKQYQTLLQQRDRDIEKSHAYLTRVSTGSDDGV